MKGPTYWIRSHDGKIRNEHGSPAAWLRAYSSFEAAREALRVTLGWGDVWLSEPFPLEGEEGEPCIAWCAFETMETRERGSVDWAPRIIKGSL